MCEVFFSCQFSCGFEIFKGVNYYSWLCKCLPVMYIYVWIASILSFCRWLWLGCINEDSNLCCACIWQGQLFFIIFNQKQNIKILKRTVTRRYSKCIISSRQIFVLVMVIMYIQQIFFKWLPVSFKIFFKNIISNFKSLNWYF